MVLLIYQYYYPTQAGPLPQALSITAGAGAVGIETAVQYGLCISLSSLSLFLKNFLCCTEKVLHGLLLITK